MGEGQWGKSHALAWFLIQKGKVWIGARMRIFRNLEVWKASHLLSLQVYQVTRFFPKEESYGLTNQIRRAALSISTNIAEGAGRYGNAEFAHFLQISLGSANEVDHQLLVAKDLGYLSSESYASLSKDVEGIQKMLVVFLQKVRAMK